MKQPVKILNVFNALTNFLENEDPFQKTGIPFFLKNT